jgi:hypothetical protein
VQRSSTPDLVELEEAAERNHLKRHDSLTDDDLPNPQNTSVSSSDEDDDDALSVSDSDSCVSGVGLSCGVSDSFTNSSPEEPKTNSSGITLLSQNDDDYCPKKKKRFFSRFRRQQRQDTVPAVFDLEQYMMKREMTVTQEKWNALTVLPNAAYCLYFVLSAQWLSQWSVDSVVDQSALAEGMVGGCYNTSSFWHSMPALPPLPVLAVAIGICLHAPWSFLYHWTYAHSMSATQRSKHWSRRMDQSMIHVASAFLSYASSGSLNFFFANVLYNMDCVRRQFRPTVRPKRNQMRILFSIVAYTLPLVKRGEYSSFVHLWILFAISGWFFVQYPVGGWSHAVFHIVIAWVPPLLMRTATQLPASAPQLQLAALCAAAAR